MDSALSPPDEVQLSAWLDGELEPDEQARVASWLNTHPEQAAQVRRWAADRDALRVLLEPQLDEALPDGLLAGTGPLPSLRRPLRRLGLAAGMLLASGLTGALLGRHWPAGGPGSLDGPASASAVPWLQRAAAAHAVYAPEQRHPVEVSVTGDDPVIQKAQQEHLAHWLSKRLNRPVALFDLQAQGFTLLGGRLLPDDPAPGAQLMYEDSRRQRITVYLRQPETPAPAAFRYEQVRGLGMFYWVDGGTAYAVTGGLPREQLLALAISIHRQGPNPAAGG